MRQLGLWKEMRSVTSSCRNLLPPGTCSFISFFAELIKLYLFKYKVFFFLEYCPKVSTSLTFGSMVSVHTDENRITGWCIVVQCSSRPCFSLPHPYCVQLREPRRNCISVYCVVVLGELLGGLVSIVPIP